MRQLFKSALFTSDFPCCGCVAKTLKGLEAVETNASSTLPVNVIFYRGPILSYIPQEVHYDLYPTVIIWVCGVACSGLHQAW